MTPANPCPICGQPIPERPKGSRHGYPPKTCSEACRKERTRRIERERYHSIKKTDAWKATRKSYLKKLRARLDSEPEFAAIFRAEAAAHTRAWAARVKLESPEQYEEIKARKRAERQAWRQALMSDPAAWEAHKTKCRAWYHSLPEEERNRIFYEPRRQRARKLEAAPERLLAEQQQ